MLDIRKERAKGTIRVIIVKVVLRKQSIVHTIGP